jgi:hypothetical protein
MEMACKKKKRKTSGSDVKRNNRAHQSKDQTAPIIDSPQETGKKMWRITRNMSTYL